MEVDKNEVDSNAEADNVVEILTAGPKVNNCTFSNDGKFLLIATICGYQVFSIDEAGECTLQYATAQRMSITLIQCALSGLCFHLPYIIVLDLSVFNFSFLIQEKSSFMHRRQMLPICTLKITSTKRYDNFFSMC